MKLNLEVRQFGEVKAKEIAEFIEYQEAVEVTIKDGSIMMSEDSGQLSQTDIFLLGSEYGKEKENLTWTKPESLYIPNECICTFKKAIQNYAIQTFIKVSGIEFKECGKVTEIIFEPQQLKCLFGIFTEYGKLCKKLELQKA